VEYQFEKVNCVLCNSDDSDSITSKGQFGIETHVVLCKKCSLCYLNPRWNEESYFHFYQHKYDSYYRPNESNLKEGQDQIAKAIFNRLENLNLLPQNPESILDIGSGKGEILMFLKSKFPRTDLFAIEPSLQAQEILMENSITVLSGDINSDWNAKGQKFDFIIMRHVLEHFSDPLKVLKNIKSLLSDDGICYIAVPNNLNPSPKLRSYWFRAVHTYYFNKPSLENIFKLAGLKLLNCTEGDQYNRRELFTLVTNGEFEDPVFDPSDYNLQKQKLDILLKREANFLLKTASIVKRVMKKLGFFSN
jgi:SAM-dependent methyltransferase